MDGMLNRCEAVTHKVLAGLVLGLLVLILCWTAAMGATERGGTLRIGMTAADIPIRVVNPIKASKGFASSGTSSMIRWYAGTYRKGNSFQPLCQAWPSRGR
jgi:hypothetical protein